MRFRRRNLLLESSKLLRKVRLSPSVIHKGTSLERYSFHVAAWEFGILVAVEYMTDTSEPRVPKLQLCIEESTDPTDNALSVAGRDGHVAICLHATYRAVNDPPRSRADPPNPGIRHWERA